MVASGVRASSDTPFVLGNPPRGQPGLTLRSVSAEEIDSYLAELPEPQRAALEDLRALILTVIPAAEQCISYRIPAFRVDGSVVAGFAAFKNHMSYLPFSGSVLPALRRELRRYEHTKSALHFTPGSRLPDDLVVRMVHLRLEEIRNRGH